MTDIEKIIKEAAEILEDIPDAADVKGFASEKRRGHAGITPEHGEWMRYLSKQLNQIVKDNKLVVALEKQIPTPPEYKVHEKYQTLGYNHYCKCGEMFSCLWNITNYCKNCGQKLKGDK